MPGLISITCYVLGLFLFKAHEVLSIESKDITIPKQQQPSDVEEGCEALLENFAATVGLFTFCAISHARPIRVCEKCIETYLNVLNAHDAILELEDHSGQACKMELINLDRLEVIESTFHNVDELWLRGNCNNCFNFKQGMLTSELTNNTKRFQLLHNKNEACFERYINETVKNSTSDVCEDCKKIYCKVNEFYNQIKEKNGDANICIDIVDAMNSTRTRWSQQFGCTLNSMRIEWQFIVTACFVSLTPLAFYLTARLFSGKKESRVLQKPRLKRTSKPSTSPSTSRLATT